MEMQFVMDSKQPFCGGLLYLALVATKLLWRWEQDIKNSTL